MNIAGTHTLRSNHIQIYQAEPFGGVRPHRTTLRCESDKMDGYDILDVTDMLAEWFVRRCRESVRP